jgi:hypothetical protein
VGTYTQIMKQDKIMKQDQFRKNKNSYICVVLSRRCVPRPGLLPFFCAENSNNNCSCHLPPGTQNMAIIQITVVQCTASYLPICAALTAAASVRVDDLSDPPCPPSAIVGGWPTTCISSTSSCNNDHERHHLLPW